MRDTGTVGTRLKVFDAHAVAAAGYLVGQATMDRAACPQSPRLWVAGCATPLDVS